MRIGVVGAGISGAFTAWELARDGHDVVLLERHDIGHCLGSSHGASRVIRKTYPDILHTRLMEEAYPLWDRAQASAGSEWMVRTGILYVGPEGHPELREVANALDQVGVPWRTVRAEGRFQGLQWREGEIGIYQDDGGYLRAGDAVRGAVEQAAKSGAEILPRVAVASISLEGGEVRCETDLGERVFDRVVICAGAWIDRLVPALEPYLRPTRQTWGYASRNHADPCDAPDMVWIDAESHWYGFPKESSFDKMKIARHRPGLPVDPDSVERHLRDPEVLEMAEVAAARLGWTGEIVDTATCIYTNTPDEKFILDHTLNGFATIVSGCSGHGFKFGPLIGRLAADACVEGKWREDLSPFRADRLENP